MHQLTIAGKAYRSRLLVGTGSTLANCLKSLFQSISQKRHIPQVRIILVRLPDNLITLGECFF